MSKELFDTRLIYTAENSEIPYLEGFIDVDFAANLDKRRSTTRFVFKLYGIQ